MKGLKPLKKILGIATLVVASLLLFSPAHADICEPKWSWDRSFWYWYCWNTPEPIHYTPSSDSPTPTPEPTYTEVQPSPDPSPSLSSLSAEPSVLPSETQPPKIIVPSETIPPIIVEPSLSSIPQDVNYVTLDNGVELTKEEAQNVELLQNTSALVSAILVNPGKALKALGSIGKDMSPKKRKKAQEVVFPVVIVSSVISSTSNLLTRGRVK